jgi:hypothetical protein
VWPDVQRVGHTASKKPICWRSNEGYVQQDEIRRQYQRGKKYRERNATEIAEEKLNAEQMHDWLEKDERLDKTNKEVQNLMRAVQNRARHVRKHEKNPDY